jgi:class 3 adenylate cyclase
MLVEPRMHPLTLRFPADWERLFRHGTAARSRLQSRVSLSLAFVNLVGIGFWFLLTVSAEEGGPPIGSVFFVSSIPALLALTIALTPAYSRFGQLALGAAFLGSGLAQASVAAVLPTQLGAAVTCISVTVVLLFGFVFMGTGVAVAVPVGLLVGAAALWTTLAANVGWAHTSANWLGIISGLGGSVGAGYFVEYYLRRDFVRQRLLDAERQRSERLLLNVMPAPIAERLKAGEEPIADSYPETTVLFADIVNFTGISSRVSPDQLVVLLNDVFSDFDRIAAHHRLEKIKTIGDAYMVVGGLPDVRADHAEAVAEMALAMMESVAERRDPTGDPLKLRIGINTGPVVAGVIGTAKFAYDLWGDAVNTAARMESHGVPEGIQVTEDTYQRLKGRYHFEARGPVDIKGKGAMPVYLLCGRA